MAKFKVFIDQTVQYYTIVEAEDAEEAEAKATGPDATPWKEYNTLRAEVRDDLTEEVVEEINPHGMPED